MRQLLKKLKLFSIWLWAKAGLPLRPRHQALLEWRSFRRNWKKSSCSVPSLAADLLASRNMRRLAPEVRMQDSYLYIGKNNFDQYVSPSCRIYGRFGSLC